MKKILTLVALLFGGAFAATSALYLHHERSTQATIEADCQNREICLDKTNLAPLGRFNDGTLFHVVSQEKPNVNLTGTLGVTGATTLSNTLTLSALTANLPLFTNGTSQATTNAMTGTGSVVMSTGGSLTAPALTSPTVATSLTASYATASTAAAFDASKNLVSVTNTGTGSNVLSNNAVLVAPTLGAATATTLQTTGSIGIGMAPSASLDVVGSNSPTSRAALFRTGLTTGGAASDYVDILFRHVNSIGGFIDGASIRSTVVNPANGTRTSKIGIYGSNNEAQTLGLEIAANGAATVPVSLSVTGATTLTGGVTLGASFVDKTTALTSNTTLTTAHSTILANATGGAFTITLPTAVGNAGLLYSIFKNDASTNSVSIATTSSQKISGFTAYGLIGNASVSRLIVISDGSNWLIKEAYDYGTFTYTEATGVASTPTGIGRFTLTDVITQITLVPVAGTGNSTAFTVTGIPSLAIPATAKLCRTVVTDNGVAIGALASVSNAGTITFSAEVATGTPVTFNASGFTASGTKQVGNGTSDMVISYSIF